MLAIEEGKLQVVDINSCILCGECVNACPVDPAAISQGHKPDVFLFTVESTGCLPPERIVSEAGKILTAKLDQWAGKIERDEVHDEIAGHVRVSVEKAIRIGELLTEQKAELEHGQWLPWVEDNVPFTSRTAEKYMRLHEQRDSGKIESGSNLTSAYRAIGLLAEPEPVPQEETLPAVEAMPEPADSAGDCS